MLSGKALAREVIIRAMHTWTAARNRHRVTQGDVNRILLLRPDHLGDLLFATPSLELVRRRFPRAHITGAVGPWGRAMWEGNKDLDALVTIPFPGIAGHRDGGAFAPYRLLGDFAQKLKREKYDLGIVLRFDHWWGAALMWAAGIPHRWGYDTPGMGAWLTNRVPYRQSRHEVEQDIRLVEAVCQVGERQTAPLHVRRDTGTPPLTPPAPTRPLGAGSEIDAWLKFSRRVAIHPGTGAANKLWTLDGWAEVIATLQAQGWSITLTGSPGERALSEAIVTRIGDTHHLSGNESTGFLCNFAGATANLRELAWVFTEAHMVLGVDSGPLHIATALDRPTLHLYGPTDERVWGPWGPPDRHRPLRAPGTKPTMHLEVGSPALEGGPEMRAITPEMVISEVGKLAR